MTTLHVLMPPMKRAAPPDLQHWLARGDRLADVQHPRSAMLRRWFRFTGNDVPAAALRHHLHHDDAGSGSWLCADPAYVRSEPTGARLMACPLSDLSDTEAHDLSAALKPLFGDAGMPLTLDTPSAWCLRLGETPKVAFTNPEDALGAGLLDCLPQGDAGRRWRHLFNEAQITLHAHPVNASRTAAAKLPVNALWFWGAGTLPASVETALTTVATSDEVIRGLAKAARIRSVSPTPDALEGLREEGNVLLDLGAQQWNEDSSSRWLAYFRSALRSRRFDAIELAFASGECFRVRRAHRLRFWRRG
ncbi:MAG: phosphoglycerate mutase [Rhodanobacteraceae bacterium]